MTDQGRTNIAIISNEPTPYRLHLLTRVARELTEAKLHSLFTHRFYDASEPWQMQADKAINPVFFEHLALTRSLSIRAFDLYREIAQYIGKHNIQLVVMNGYNDLTRVLLARWCKQQNIPLLLRGDSNIYSEGRVPPLRRTVKAYFLRWLLSQVAGLMPMGTCGRAFFRLWVDHRLPTFLCPYEPNYDALQQCDDATRSTFMNQHQLDPARKRLLYCGRLAPVKRVDVLLDAFAKVADECPQWDLVIAGDGAMRESLQKQIPEALKPRVKFVGFLQFEDTVACYHSCNALVHPSEYEPWALVINEAVAAGLAVIATEVTGAAVELVRHGINGLIVPPGDVQQLAGAMRQVTSGDTCNQMRAAASTALAQWRAAADPVDGIRQALHYFTNNNDTQH